MVPGVLFTFVILCYTSLKVIQPELDPLTNTENMHAIMVHNH